MVRAFVVAVCLAALPASPQAAPPAQPPPQPSRSPSSAAAAAAPASRPSFDDLHAQAYTLMAAGKFDKAAPLLNRAFDGTPEAQRSRALVLNRAILDLVQKRNVLRGVKDLYAYLGHNERPDEDASNILGASLNLVADNEKWRDGPIYADAFREFARREAVLERGRPGFRRWGAGWITQAEYDAIKLKDKDLTEQIASQYQTLSTRTTDLNGLREQYATAGKQYAAYSTHRHPPMKDRPVYISNCPSCQALLSARQTLNELSVEIRKASVELQQVRSVYESLQKKQIKPTWPARFEPINPAAPEPPPPPIVPLGLDVATQPATPQATQPATQPAADSTP